MTYNEPNYAEAQKQAYNIVMQSHQKLLPMSVKKIIKVFENLHIQKYTVFARKQNLSLEEVYELVDSEDGCLWMRNDGTYLILYNDTITHSGRVRFTLAHELGHYILKHNEKTGKTILPRYSLSDAEYDVFEKEANYFAKRLLAPLPLIDLYVANWDRMFATNIEFAFDTSFTMANYVIRDLIKRQQKANIIRESHPMMDLFIDYINQDSNSKICKKCYTIQPTNHEYCSTCGQRDFVESSVEDYPNYYVMKGKVMEYSKIETNEQGTPFKCPRCEYEGLEDEFNYCPICSTHIHNVCLGGERTEYTKTYEGAVKNTIQERYDDERSCGGYLEGVYRYCPDCGSITSYGYQGLLKNWEEEKEIKERLPF